MIKVRFDNDHYKLIEKYGKRTKIMLEGFVLVDREFAMSVPRSIYGSFFKPRTENIEIHINEKDGIVIYAKGVVRCCDNDKYDTILGERIAESYAKQNLYKYIYKFLNSIIRCYSKIIGIDLKTCKIKDSNNSIVNEYYKYLKYYNDEVEHTKELISKVEKNERA